MVLLKIGAIGTPATKKHVQKFLGIVNYYRQHIPGLAEIAAPLYALTSGKSETRG